MREDMDPSMTMKSLLPLVLVPVTLQTSAPAFATMDRPGSMMMVKPSSSMAPLTAPIRSAGDGMVSPLEFNKKHDSVGNEGSGRLTHQPALLLMSALAVLQVMLLHHYHWAAAYCVMPRRRPALRFPPCHKRQTSHMQRSHKWLAAEAAAGCVIVMIDSHGLGPNWRLAS